MTRRKGTNKARQWITEDGLSKLEEMARKGLADAQIATNMGISRSTLNEWKEKYPEIGERIAAGKKIVDAAVENALLKRALGFSYMETVRESYVDPETGKEVTRVREYEKKALPDVSAQKFWLKNRNQEWRNEDSPRDDLPVPRLICVRPDE